MGEPGDRPSDLIDNDLYDREGDGWWRPDSVLNLLERCINPVRVGYFRGALLRHRERVPPGGRVLDVGCGGGIVTEELARMGFDAVGIDPSLRSLETARRHARENGLRISYDHGRGEALPYPAGSFDAVFCCDVLEHVRDAGEVVAEISRVLKPGGLLCYDTLNRTPLSWLVAIGVAQRWRRWAFLPTWLHVWEMFITPKEMKRLLRLHRLSFHEHRGLWLASSLPVVMGALAKRARGELAYRELGDMIRLRESRHLGVVYMGCATRD